MKTVGIQWSGVKDKSTLTLLIKSMALEDRDLLFLVEGTETDFLPFQGFDNIQGRNREDVLSAPILLSEEEHFRALRKEAKLELMPLSQQEGKTAYLALYRSWEEAEEDFPKVVNPFLREGEKVVSCQRPVGSYETIPVEEIFQNKGRIVLMQKEDFAMVLGFVEAVADLMKSREKMGVFASIGNYFFKNYIHHPEKLSSRTFLPSWHLSFHDGQAAIDASTTMNMDGWKDLLQTLLR